MKNRRVGLLIALGVGWLLALAAGYFFVPAWRDLPGSLWMFAAAALVGWAALALAARAHLDEGDLRANPPGEPAEAGALERVSPRQARRILGVAAVARESGAADTLARRCLWHPPALEIAARCIRQTRGDKRPIAHFLQLLDEGRSARQDLDDLRGDLFTVFDQGCAGMSPADARRFFALSVFASSGFSPAAAAAVWGLEEAEANRVLERLTGRSLLAPAPGGLPRCCLPGLLGEYATAGLNASGGAEEAWRRMAGWLVSLFEQNELADVSAAPVAALELDNLRRAARDALERGDGDRLALLATKPRNWYMNVFGNLEEWQDWLRTALRLGIGGAGLRAAVYTALGDVRQAHDDWSSAMENYTRALELYREAGDVHGEAHVLGEMGDVRQFRDELEEALEIYAQALDLYRRVGDRLGEANTLKAIGDTLQLRQEFEAALENHSRALELYRVVGNRLGEANVLRRIGDTRQVCQEMDAALESYARALDLYRGVGDRLGQANTLKAVGDVWRQLQEPGAAREHYTRALELFREVGDRLGETNTLSATIRLDVHAGDTTSAARRLETVLVMRRELGSAYGEGVDLGNFALALLNAGRPAEALPYARRAREIFARMPLPEQVEWIDGIIAACSG